jgi:hypothetical protein
MTTVDTLSEPVRILEPVGPFGAAETGAVPGNEVRFCAHPAVQTTVLGAGPAYRVYSVAQRHEARRQAEETDAVAHPAFMLHTDLRPYWSTVYREFPEYQIVLRDNVTDNHLAHGNMVPLHLGGADEELPGTAVEMVEQALRDKRDGRPPTVLGALQAVVHPKYQGRGMSAETLRAMAGVAGQHGFWSLFAPIRPSRKAQTPLTPFDQYVETLRSDGLPMDPWQRVHVRLGATPAGIAERWLTVRATVGEWSWWTGTPSPGRWCR